MAVVRHNKATHLNKAIHPKDTRHRPMLPRDSRAMVDPHLCNMDNNQSKERRVEVLGRAVLQDALRLSAVVVSARKAVKHALNVSSVLRDAVKH